VEQRRKPVNKNRMWGIRCFPDLTQVGTPNTNSFSLLVGQADERFAFTACRIGFSSS